MSRGHAAALLTLALTMLGFCGYARVLDGVIPAADWLFWSILRVWGYMLLFSAATVCFGQLILTRLLRLTRLAALESAVLSVCVGTFGLCAAMFVAGTVGLFTPAFALTLALAMLGTGARSGLALSARAQLGGGARLSPLATCCACFGVVALLLLYLQSFTPDAINYDAGWMHVKFAEDYARHGRLVPFPGSYHGGLPHLASLLYTWAYLVPGPSQPERWMLVLHLEFSLVAWTLAAIAAATQRMLGNWTLRSTWAAFFLFPGIFVYDSNPGGAADHVHAFFATCLVICMLRVVRGFSWGSSVVLSVAGAGALLTKYQGFYILLPAGLIVLGAALIDAWRTGGEETYAAYRRHVLRALVWMAGVGASLVAPHFLKNWIFYHNPVYPLMQQTFTSSWPSVPNGWFYFNQIYTDPNWVPHGEPVERLRGALRLFATFSFEPHYTFNGGVPVFGSLFTLLLPAIFWIRSRRRVALPALVGSVAILLWGYTYTVDRNLQVFMPILACVVGAVLVELWELGPVARLGLVPLVALQLVWGADAAFYSSRDRLAKTANLISSSFDRTAFRRFESFRATYVSIGAALPRDAKLLLHTTHVALGIDRDTIQDWAGFQGLITYAPMRTPRDLFQRYRALRVSHILDEGSLRPAPSKQEDVLYQTFVTRYMKKQRHFSGYRLFTMPKEAPPQEAPYQVLCLGLRGYDDGLYPIERLDTIEYIPREFQRFKSPSTPAQGDNRAALAERADALLCGPSDCSSAIEHGGRKYSLAIAYPRGFSIYIRR